MLYTFARTPAITADPAGQAGKTHRGDQAAGQQTSRKGEDMGRIIKALLLLVILGFVGLVVYAYLGDLSPVQNEVKKPVVLNADD
jgi:hypothetical protein